MSITITLTKEQIEILKFAIFFKKIQKEEYLKRMQFIGERDAAEYAINFLCELDVIRRLLEKSK